MEPATTIKTVSILLAKVGTWWARRNDEAFKQERDELFREWTSELAIALKQQISALDQAEASIELLSKLDQLSDSREFWRVLDNYGYEASREAVDERRKMLAWAAAGSLTAGLTVAQMARVERTIRELDPGDIAILRRLHELSAPPAKAVAPSSEWVADLQEKAKERHLLWQEGQPSGHILAAAGCVLVQDYNWQFPVQGNPGLTVPTVVPVITVTGLGGWVLDVTRGYYARGE